jgi:hypothetical protein
MMIKRLIYLFFNMYVYVLEVKVIQSEVLLENR